MTRMLVVRPLESGQDEYEVIDEPSDLRTLQGLVEGYIEPIYPFDEPVEWWHAYCNEEGKLRRLPVNELASVIAHAHGWPRGDWLVGTVVFLGPDASGMGEGDVPEDLIAYCKQTVEGL